MVRRHFRLNGRMFAWRQTQDPYQILVSELMLQQTQTHRVEPKFAAFIAAYPTVAVLAQAPLRDVYALWQGLGYNRRARFLHAAAQYVVASCDGRMPDTYEQLLTLPGVGPYTAAAVAAFAYNKPVVMIETNIRTVYLHHFFPNTKDVPDSELLWLIQQTLPVRDSRRWYAALMDYGAYLKVTQPNPSRRSKHHTKQKPFSGSVREVRGAIMRLILNKPKITVLYVEEATGFSKKRIREALQSLIKDGTLNVNANQYTLKD